jgi:hypothetical protein
MTAPLVDRIAQAVGDPGSFLPRLHRDDDERREAITRWSTRAVVAVLTEALTIEPCHITGMHDPDHHVRYTCAEQLREVASRMITGLGLTIDELPHRLHEKCGWCHNVGTQEKYRERMRESHRWAGVEIPAELAAPAPDAPRPGDTDLVLAHFPDGWRYWPDVLKEIESATSLHSTRISLAYHALLTDGSVEEHRNGPGSPDVRRAQHVTAGDASGVGEAAPSIANRIGGAR